MSSGKLVNTEQRIKGAIRDFIQEVEPKQKVWTTPLSKLLLKIKAAVAEAKEDAEGTLSEGIKTDFRRHYDKLVKRANRPNSHPPKAKKAATPRKSLSRNQLPTPSSTAGKDDAMKSCALL